MLELVSAAGNYSPENQCDSAQLHPQALEFLQSVYGIDRRLDTMPQSKAEALADMLLHEYALHYGETTHEALQDSYTYDTAVQAVSLYVRGEQAADIAPKIAQWYDAADVETHLQDVAVRLRDYNQCHIESNDWPLESLLRSFVGAPETGAYSDRHMVPLGAKLYPIIEHSLDTATGQQVRLEQLLEARRTELIYLGHIAQQAEQAMAEYAATPEFRRAAARRGHDKDSEIFVIGPGDTDADSQVLRHMSWLVSTAVFARKDGNTLADMQEHMNNDCDFHILAVDQSGEHPQPMGALYAKVQSLDSLPSVQDIWYEWGRPVREAMRCPELPEHLRGVLPDRMYQSDLPIVLYPDRKPGIPDLRYHPKVLDIMTIAALPKYENGGVVMAMYNRACRICDILGLEYIVNILDEGAGNMLNKYGRMFLSYAGLKPINYKARRKYANRSLPRWVHLPSWKRWLQVNNKHGYDRFWAEQPQFARKRYHLADVTRYAHLA